MESLAHILNVCILAYVFEKPTPGNIGLSIKSCTPGHSAMWKSTSLVACGVLANLLASNGCEGSPKTPATSPGPWKTREGAVGLFIRGLVGLCVHHNFQVHGYMLHVSVCETCLKQLYVAAA